MKLPEKFQETLGTLLGEAEYEALSQALSEQRTWGLRVNTLKISVECCLKRQEMRFEPIRWSRDGFRHDGSRSPGRHPDYHAGLFYLQDPSAMLPAELLDPLPGEHVLDLCAAPGGKTAQLAAMMRNEGFLLANDISPKRVKPLARNLQGLGISCAAVLCESPETLAHGFPGHFDKILLDVPCSGEGMFRKDDQAVKSWLKAGPETFLPIQRELLLHAWSMLKPGGRLVYSTCTYNPDENERNIAWAMERLPDMQVETVDAGAMGLQPGRSDWIEAREQTGNPEEPESPDAGKKLPALSGAVRIWPHLAAGEGQFAVRLVKWNDGLPAEMVVPSLRKRTCFQQAPEPAIQAWRSFVETDLTEMACLLGCGTKISDLPDIVQTGTLLHLLPWAEKQVREALPHLRAEMPGLLLGEWRNDRFEPSAALLHAMAPDAAARRLELSEDSPDVSRYLHGETILREGERGWTAILAGGFPLGWGKQEDGFIKNRYPKGWRMQ